MLEIDTTKLLPADKQLRQNVRNYIYPMTKAEMMQELEISLDIGDFKRWAFIAEMLDETYIEGC